METIKYEIPDGYECTLVEKETKEDSIVLKHTLTKVNKDFNWYISGYLNKTKWIAGLINENQRNDIIVGFCIPDYNSIPFEIKIGLLRFICDDLNLSRKDKYSYVFILNQYEYGTTKDCEFMKAFDSICPKEFVDSLV